MWRPAESTKFFFLFLLNNEAWEHTPARISETFVSCRDLIRRQHRWFIALPLLSASTDVQEVHTRVIMPSLCVFSMSICYLCCDTLLPCLAPWHITCSFQSSSCQNQWRRVVMKCKNTWAVTAICMGKVIKQRQVGRRSHLQNKPPMHTLSLLM